MTINDIPYVKTSLQYADASAYYGSVFTDEALQQVMSIKYADIDGGKTGSVVDFKFLTETDKNTYD